MTHHKTNVKNALTKNDLQIIFKQIQVPNQHWHMLEQYNKIKFQYDLDHRCQFLIQFDPLEPQILELTDNGMFFGNLDSDQIKIINARLAVENKFDGLYLGRSHGLHFECFAYDQELNEFGTFNRPPQLNLPTIQKLINYASKQYVQLRRFPQLF